MHSGGRQSVSLTVIRRGRGPGNLWRRVGPCACVLALALIAVGQDAPNLAAIRKTDLRGTLDRQNLTAWVRQQVEELYSAAAPVPAAVAFHRQMLEQFQAADATAGFKSGLAEITSEVFLDRYRGNTAQRASANPMPTLMALAVLRQSGDPSGVAAFRAALGDPRASVRLAAADGLLVVKVPEAQWRELLPELQQAAMTEPDPVTLSRLCRVMTRPGGPPTREAAGALLKVLDAKLTRIETQGEVATRASAEIVAWLGAQFAGINDAQFRADMVRHTARLLADAVYVYEKEVLEPAGDETTPENEERRIALEARIRELERIIAEAELQLKAMVKPPDPQPNVSAALFESSKATRAEKLSQELGLWIGSDAGAGVLNGPPFNLERGLNIQRTPATQPQEAGPG